jgi:hypothetical protein
MEAEGGMAAFGRHPGRPSADAQDKSFSERPLRAKVPLSRFTGVVAKSG